METYDLVMLVVLVAAGLFGAIKGFAWQIASIVSLSFSYWVAMKFREPFSHQIHAESPWNMFLAMFLLFVGSMIAIWMVFRMLSSWIDKLRLREFDRMAGAVFGLAKGAIYCILITLFAVSLAGDSIRLQIVQSKSGYYIAKLLDHSDVLMPEEIHEIVGPYLDRLDEKLRPGDQPSAVQPSPLHWSASREQSQGAGEAFEYVAPSVSRTANGQSSVEMIEQARRQSSRFPSR
ncbi:MAG: CvpA family protein [Pirellulaceae bacterium]